MTVNENVSLRPYNTFGLDATARYFAAFHTVDELRQLLSDARLAALPRMILGGGSNVLLTQHVDGLVLKNELIGMEVLKEDADYAWVRAGAGENWHRFVQYCIGLGLGGLENLSLIPGNVGASPMQNIGAYGVEIKDTFQELEALNLETLQTERFNNAACEFGYRESVFKRRAKNQYVILNVTFRLLKKPVINTSYGAIEQELEKMGITAPTIRDVSNAVINIRSSKLPNPAEIGNAGSFFKNPEIDAAKYAQLKAAFPELVAYPLPGDHYKLAAGWLIEQCGWKGYREGDAGVHAKQALVLVNYGNATGEAIYALSTKVLESVQEKFGVTLEREVNVI